MQINRSLQLTSIWTIFYWLLIYLVHCCNSNALSKCSFIPLIPLIARLFACQSRNSIETRNRLNLVGHFWVMLSMRAWSRQGAGVSFVMHFIQLILGEHIEALTCCLNRLCSKECSMNIVQRIHWSHRLLTACVILLRESLPLSPIVYLNLGFNPGRSLMTTNWWN